MKIRSEAQKTKVDYRNAVRKTQRLFKRDQGNTPGRPRRLETKDFGAALAAADEVGRFVPTPREV